MNTKTIKYEDLFFSRTWDFLNNYLPNQLCRSKDTIESYRDSLSIFRKYISETADKTIQTFSFSDCTKDFVFSFREYLLKKNNAPSTVNTRISAIVSYFRYAADFDISLQSLALKIASMPPCRVPKKEKEVISNEALAAMFSAPGSSKIGIRDQTFMILLYDSAVRLNEILSLKIKDLSLDGEYPCILLHGKGNKERRAVISTKTADHIRRYMLIYHKGCRPDDLLFYITIKGVTGKMSHANAQRIINKYAGIVRNQGIDIPDKVHPHMFRRTKATALYQNDVPLEMISTLLGHSQLETTKIYAVPSLEKIKEAMDKVKTPAYDEKPLWTNDDEFAKYLGLR